MKKMKAKFVVILSLVFSVALLPSAAAHKYFFGLTEISYNQRTQHVEIIHQLTLHDVQRALKKRFGDDFRIDSAAADTKIQAWLENHFTLFDSNNQLTKLQWVGFEADFQNIWLYQELPVEATSFCGWRVSNSLLMNEYAPQVNTVNFVTETSTNGVSLTRENHTKTIDCQ